MKKAQENTYKGFKMNAIELNKIEKKFSMSNNSIIKKKEDLIVFKDISLDVKKGESLGIIGPNGSGKTTLLKVIGNIIPPDKGNVSVCGKCLVLIDIGSGFRQDLTGKENIYYYGSIIGMSKSHLKKNEKKIIEFSELSDFIEEKISKYSNGMKLRLAFSIIAHADFDILLLDEVLAVGDINFQRKCINKIFELKSKKKTILFISHDFNLVKEFCDKCILLSNSKIKKIGKPEEVIDYYLNDSIKLKVKKAYEKIKKEYETYQNYSSKNSKSIGILKFLKKNIPDERENKKQNLGILIEVFFNEILNIELEIENKDKEQILDELKYVNYIWKIYSSLKKQRIDTLHKKIRLFKLYLENHIRIKIKKQIFKQIVSDYETLIKQSKNKQRYIDEFYSFLYETQPPLILIEEIYQALKVYGSIPIEKNKKKLTNLIKKLTLLMNLTNNYLKLKLNEEQQKSNKIQISSTKKNIDRLEKYREKILGEFNINKSIKNKVHDVEIENINIYNSNNKENLIFKTGDFLKIKIGYNAFKRIKNPVFGIAIFTDEEKLITGPNTKFHNVVIKSIFGKGSVSYIIPELPLLEGTYYISVTIHPFDSFEPYDHHDKLYSFKVKNQNIKDLGFFHIKSRWEIND